MRQIEIDLRNILKTITCDSYNCNKFFLFNTLAQIKFSVYLTHC